MYRSSLEDFADSIGVMLLNLRLLRSPDIFLKPSLFKPKISRSSSSTSTSALDCVVVEVSESRKFFSNFVRLTLVVCSPLLLTGLVFSSSFNHFQSQRSRSALILWVPQIFTSSASSMMKMVKKCSCVLP